MGCVLIVLTILRQSLAQPSSCYIHEENDIKDLSSFFQKTDLFLRDFIHRFDSNDTIHQTGSPALFNYTRKALGLSYSIADEIEFARALRDIISLPTAKEGDATENVDARSRISAIERLLVNVRSSHSSRKLLEDLRKNLGCLIFRSDSKQMITDEEAVTKAFLSMLTLSQIRVVFGFNQTRCPQGITASSNCSHSSKALRFIDDNVNGDFYTRKLTVKDVSSSHKLSLAFTDRLPYLDLIDTSLKNMKTIDLSKCSEFVKILYDDQLSLNHVMVLKVVDKGKRLLSLYSSVESFAAVKETTGTHPMSRHTKSRHPRAEEGCESTCLNGGQCMNGICQCTPGYAGSSCKLFTCQCSSTLQVCVGPGQCSDTTATEAPVGAIIAVPIVFAVLIIIMVFVVIFLMCVLKYRRKQMQKRAEERERQNVRHRSV